MSKLAAICLLGVSMCVAAPVMASEKPEKSPKSETPTTKADKPAKPSEAASGSVWGKITAIDDTSITVKNKDGDHTFKINAKTSVVKDGEPVTEKLAVGTTVGVTFEDGVATKIRVSTGNKKKPAEPKEKKPKAEAGED